MVLRTIPGHMVVATVLLMFAATIIYIYFKPALSLEPHMETRVPKDDVCTDACLESLKLKDDLGLQDCPVDTSLSKEKNEDTQKGVSKKGAPYSEAEILVLVWWWPFGAPFPVDTCEPLYGIKNCLITDDRSQYENADAVLFHVRDIGNQLHNMMRMPRPPLQYWVWMNSESPGYSPHLSGAEDLFNLTSNYRRDSDVWVPYGRVMRASEEQIHAFTIPKKDKLVCWIITHWDESLKRSGYFNEFSKHIEVEGFGQHFGRSVSNDDYFNVIKSCKFYLSFENSVYKDYISEKIYNPLVLGTVPVVLGPARDNYEEFIPRDAFIHVDDFKTPKELAEHLKLVDQNQEMYEQYFAWRKLYFAELGYPEEHACRTCEYIRMNKNFRVFKDVNKWYFN